MEAQLQEEVAALFALADYAEQLPKVDIEHEVLIRQKHLTRLSEAKKVLEERAAARYAQEMAEYEAKMAVREEKSKKTNKKPTGRPPQPPTPGHHPWQAQMKSLSEPPPDASLSVKMTYKLKTGIGRLIYAARKSTVEPVIGIIKEVMGFCQFALRGLVKAAGEWSLICLAYNFKRLHIFATA